ncbi:MAG: flagellar basal body P-ring protein FlgI [Armatimonadetes bacterium]|nr:flagellar basal body P-ring protein FlgI [Armatimonadota bacterium]MBX3108198.1 flagellar basal body P-ring protein FlgI [Fimbriimonadaceae bacterium]
MKKLLFTLLLAAVCAAALGQNGTTGQTGAAAAKPDTKSESQARKEQEDLEKRRSAAIRNAETNGIPVEISAIGGFRGSRSNVILGYGLVVGLNGTGDSKQIAATNTSMANALSRWGTMVDPANFTAKNIAIVSVTAELPAFAAPGRKVDVTVQSLGDAKSLEGGFLLPTSLGAMADNTVTYAMASGGLSIGGFNAGNSGSSVRQNHPTVARIPNGADIQKGVDTQFVFGGNIIYFDLDQPDFTTVQRVRDAIARSFPSLGVSAIDGVTVAITLDDPNDAVDVISQVQKLEVFANTEPTVVINERTGTIVVGGNVRLGPALIAHGSLRVTIDTEFVTSQPGPFSQGQTTVTPATLTNANEQPPQVVVVAPNATLDDLAKIFQAMDVSARDIIAIIQALAQQGALKARVKIQ